jgi:hypothetical protein
MDGKQLYLKPDEMKFLSMAVMSMLEQIKQTQKNEKINWSVESRKMHKEMATAGDGLVVKMTKLGFDMRPLPPYIDGEEQDWLTKES